MRQFAVLLADQPGRAPLAVTLQADHMTVRANGQLEFYPSLRHLQDNLASTIFVPGSWKDVTDAGEVPEAPRQARGEAPLRVVRAIHFRSKEHGTFRVEIGTGGDQTVTMTRLEDGEELKLAWEYEHPI